MTADALLNALVHVSWYARESGESPVVIIITVMLIAAASCFVRPSMPSQTINLSQRSTE